MLINAFNEFPKPDNVKQIIFVSDMQTVRMTCYFDEYPLLCCTIIKFQPWYFALAIFLNLTFRPAPFKQNSHIFIRLLVTLLDTIDR